MAKLVRIIEAEMIDMERYTDPTKSSSQSMIDLLEFLSCRVGSDYSPAVQGRTKWDVPTSDEQGGTLRFGASSHSSWERRPVKIKRSLDAITSCSFLVCTRQFSGHVLWQWHETSRKTRRAHFGLIDLCSLVAKLYYVLRPVSILHIMSDLPPVPPHIVRIAAPFLLGGLWNWCLFGVLLVQFYVYSYNFPNDKKPLKLLVYTVFLLETVQTALCGADLFYWFGSGYGDVTHLGSPFASAFDIPIIESMVSLIVQYFYAYRVWVLSNKKSRWFCLLICLCSTLNAAAGFTAGIYVLIRQKFASGHNLKSIAIVWLCGNSVADVLIASAMLYHLAKRRKDTDGGFNDSALVKIVRLTIETNLLTTSVAIVSLLVILIFPNENWYTCPTAILGKLYSNTFLVSLNNRISIRNAANTREVNLNRTRAIPLAITVCSDITRRTDSDVTFVENGQTHKFAGSGWV
ncbi:hypothetical protein BJV77DRAFT_335231 [Russula vinacea]|nr:hypothetical protein BJV77DRAFT_335231 [Russula vinacea]